MGARLIPKETVMAALVASIHESFCADALSFVDAPNKSGHDELFCSRTI